jgi:hypothetical protein
MDVAITVFGRERTRFVANTLKPFLADRQGGRLRFPPGVAPSGEPYALPFDDLGPRR